MFTCRVTTVRLSHTDPVTSDRPTGRMSPAYSAAALKPCALQAGRVRISREETIDRSEHAHHEHSAAAALGECSRWEGYQSAACLVGVLAIGRGHERHRVLVRLGASGSAAQRSIASPQAQRSTKTGAGAASGCRDAACASGILIIDRTFCAASCGACPAIRQGQDGPGCASEASADASLQLRSTARWRTRSAA